MVLDHIELDMLHVADQGILSHLLGNVLYEVFLELGGVMRRADATLAEIVNLIKIFSKRLKVPPPINNLTLGMICKSARRPCLRAKAAETRHLLPVVLAMLQAMPADTPHKQTRLWCVAHVFGSTARDLGDFVDARAWLLSVFLPFYFSGSLLWGEDCACPWNGVSVGR
jgi:hypothetical protein